MIDIILDRDGILNIDAGYTYRPEDCLLPEGAAEALALLRDAGARYSIATGQSGIAKGKYHEEDMHRFHQLLLQKYKEKGIAFAAVVFCPHHPSVSDCDCRKPKQGMLRQIEAIVGPIDWAHAWGIGDKPTDSEMILAAGGRAVLVRSDTHNNRTGERYWDKGDPALAPLLANPRHYVADTLLDAAKIIINHLD